MSFNSSLKDINYYNCYPETIVIISAGGSGKITITFKLFGLPNFHYKNKDKIETFSNKQKLKAFATTRPSLKELLKEYEKERHWLRVQKAINE